MDDSKKTREELLRELVALRLENAAIRKETPPAAFCETAWPAPLTFLEAIIETAPS